MLAPVQVGKGVRARAEGEDENCLRGSSTGFYMVPASHRKYTRLLFFLARSQTPTCNAWVCWEGSMENIKTGLTHGRGDQAVLKGRHHTAGAAGWHSSLGIRVMRGTESLQLAIKSWNTSIAMSYFRAETIPTQEEPHRVKLIWHLCIFEYLGRLGKQVFGWASFKACWLVTILGSNVAILVPSTGICMHLNFLYPAFQFISTFDQNPTEGP